MSNLGVSAGLHKNEMTDEGSRESFIAYVKATSRQPRFASVPVPLRTKAISNPPTPSGATQQVTVEDKHSAPAAMPHASNIDLAVAQEDYLTERCTPTSNVNFMPTAPTEIKEESEDCSTYAEGDTNKIMKMQVPPNREEDVFCCKDNKVICVGPGVDEGNNREIIERFIKDVSYHERRYLSQEDIKYAFENSQFIIEVQRIAEEQTQTRYFVPSAIYKKTYVEVHPRDIFHANPLYLRSSQIYMFIECREDKHKKTPVTRRVTILDKPDFPKGTDNYQEMIGQWFVSGMEEDWGQVFLYDDE